MADRFFGPEDQYQVDAPQRRSDHYSSAREYAAAGEFDRGYRQPMRREAYRDRGSPEGGRYREQSDRRYDSGPRDRGDRDRDRDFFERAGDEVRSWFGDEEAERRRERDARYDEERGRRYGSPEDSHYHQWRRQRVAELDRDYDEYRRENAQRFHDEFSSFRTERQGQRECLNRVAEHMEVVGSDGEHIGKVDKVRGDRIVLAKNDPNSGGHHHSIPSRWIQSVDDRVMLRKSAAEAQAAWKDEERSGALFGGGTDERRDDENERGPHILNRSFSGTY